MTLPTCSGGCQCGAVRFRIEGPLGSAGICHCRMCQKAFGSWGAALVTVPLKNLAWTRGHPAEFRSSPIVARGYCKECGTPLHMHEDGDPNIEIAIGSLDDPNAVAAFSIQVGVESKVAWFDSLHSLAPKTTSSDRAPEDLAKLVTLQHPDHDTDVWPPR
ncbi:MAG: GFA family protein [Hyphomicrobium sp.]